MKDYLECPALRISIAFKRQIRHLSTHLSVTLRGRVDAGYLFLLPIRSTACHMLQVHTSDIRGAGTDANVYLIIYGATGRDSGRLPLENSKNNFERGQEDTFTVQVRIHKKLFVARLWGYGKDIRYTACIS